MLQKPRKNKEVNHTQLVDQLNNLMSVNMLKQIGVSKTIDMVHQTILEHCILKQDDYKKYINNNTACLCDMIVPDDVTPLQMYQTIQSFLEYNPDTTDFRRIQNVFTVIEYYKNPTNISNLGTNWKQIMGKRK